MQQLRPLLTRASFHIPLDRHRDSTVYIMGGIPTERMEDVVVELKNRVGQEFYFEVEYVQVYEPELGPFIANAEDHILNIISSRCNYYKA